MLSRDQMRFCAGAFGAMCVAAVLFGLWFPLAAVFLISMFFRGKPAPWMRRK